MGPNTLFDKSFLQSLNLDESVWFDHFFNSNICPLFYVETLADLNKSPKSGRTSEEEVGLIADKFPELHSTPNLQHITLCKGELLGNRVPMTGQIIVPGGRPVKSGAKTGVVFDQSPEANAFSRWQKREFMDIEHLYAREWRDMVTNLDLKEVASQFKKLGIDGKSCKTLEQAKILAEQIVSSTDKPFDRMQLVLLFLKIDRQYSFEILKRWSSTNYAPLSIYAPYVAYVYTVELFFQIALAANLISSDRPSNRIDIGYLFYLPFSNIFVSSDKLHNKCAPLFLRSDQQFLWGQNLKSGLNEVNEYFSKYPDIIKEKGIMSFANHPPKEGEYIISKVWDSYRPGWRKETAIDVSDKNINHKKLTEHINSFINAPTLLQTDMELSHSDPDNVVVQRFVKKRKGSWYQIPKGIKPQK